MKRTLVITLTLIAGFILTPFRVDALVNINTATSVELQTLPGIGPGLARVIIDYRESNGLFREIQDLMDVPSIGQKTFDKVKDMITVARAEERKPVPTHDAKSESDQTAPEIIATATPAPSVDEIMALFDAEPLIRDVQQAAIRFAQIDAFRFEEWRQKVKEKGLWPDTLQLTVTHGTDDDRDYTRTNTIGISGGTAYVGPDKETWKRGTDDDFDYQLRLRWKLQDYCFNSDMLRVSSETENQVKFRQGVIEDVTKLYYDRRKLQVDMILQPDVNIQVQIRRQLQLEELTAALDGMTGGFFSGALKKIASREE